MSALTERPVIKTAWCRRPVSIQQLFTEHLLCARHSIESGTDTQIDGTDRRPRSGPTQTYAQKVSIKVKSSSVEEDSISTIGAGAAGHPEAENKLPGTLATYAEINTKRVVGLNGK